MQAKAIEYKLLIGTEGMLDVDVSHHLKINWKLYGNPFTFDEFSTIKFGQAIVKLEEKKELQLEE